MTGCNLNPKVIDNHLSKHTYREATLLTESCRILNYNHYNLPSYIYKKFHPL